MKSELQALQSCHPPNTPDWHQQHASLYPGNWGQSHSRKNLIGTIFMTSVLGCSLAGEFAPDNMGLAGNPNAQHEFCEQLNQLLEDQEDSETELAARIEGIRRLIYLSVRELATIIGVTRQAVYEWIRSETQTPQQAQEIRLGALDVMVSQLEEAGVQLKRSILESEFEGSTILEHLAGEVPYPDSLIQHLIVVAAKPSKSVAQIWEEEGFEPLTMEQAKRNAENIHNERAIGWSD